MPELRHYDIENAVHFVTTSCYKRFPLLSRQRDRNLVKHLLLTKGIEQLEELHGYAIMPNHLHLVLTLSSGDKIGRIIGRLKFELSQLLFQRWEDDRYDPPFAIRDARGVRHLWYPRCFDRMCRSEKEVQMKVSYCHRNPVRAGLVSREEDYIWSSAYIDSNDFRTHPEGGAPGKTGNIAC